MNWLEMISTRAAGLVEAEKVLEICRQMYLSIDGEKLLKMTVFCNAKYATDICILFHWKSDPGTESILGKLLSAALEDFGLVNHSIWINKKEQLIKSVDFASLNRTETLDGPRAQKGE